MVSSKHLSINNFNYNIQVVSSSSLFNQKIDFIYAVSIINNKYERSIISLTMLCIPLWYFFTYDPMKDLQYFPDYVIILRRCTWNGRPLGCVTGERLNGCSVVPWDRALESVKLSSEDGVNGEKVHSHLFIPWHHTRSLWLMWAAVKQIYAI